MAILTQSGRTAMALAISNEPMHLAWGTGEASWDVPDPTAENLTANTPPPSTLATALTNEIGRRTVTMVQFVIPDDNGAIITTDVDDDSVQNRWTMSPGNAPTNHLYLLTNFDYEDAPAAVIREVGIFIGTAVIDGLPPGQRYFTPDQIADPGILLTLEHRPKIQRNPSTRQSFELVLTI